MGGLGKAAQIDRPWRCRDTRQRGSRFAVFTCVSIIVEGEGPMAVLVVAQRGQGGQTGVESRPGGGHVHRGLRGAAAVGEMLRPLGLAHQAFERETEVMMSPDHTAH